MVFYIVFFPFMLCYLRRFFFFFFFFFFHVLNTKRKKINLIHRVTGLGVVIIAMLVVVTAVFYRNFCLFGSLLRNLFQQRNQPWLIHLLPQLSPLCDWAAEMIMSSTDRAFSGFTRATLDSLSPRTLR
eukprot:TRINITY_DN286_c0_g1_i2.p1 TRINITY_DN286_c0_g1~~TRINITY_DN286_c0_g1_i2.p1  ORF type:complete len:128 (+),score=35.76 TRINITY_DN286_c0_g1_i2:20-403(+)